MSDFTTALFLRIQCEIEATITERQAMIAANEQRAQNGEAQAYPESAFMELAHRFNAIAPDPHSHS